MTPEPEEILLLMVGLTVLAGFSALIAYWVVRVAGRQRIAENLLRERLARAWGTLPRPTAETEPR